MVQSPSSDKIIYKKNWNHEIIEEIICRIIKEIIVDQVKISFLKQSPCTAYEWHNPLPPQLKLSTNKKCITFREIMLL